MLRKELQLWCASDELFPKTITVLALPNRWAALVSSIALLDLFGSQTEVVEAGLGCDVDTRLASGLEERNALRSRKMNDVKVQRRSNVRLADNLLDGVCFESRRSRFEEGLVSVEFTSRGERGFRGLHVVAHGLSDGRNHLGVEHESSRGVLEFFHGQGDILGRDGGELINLVSVSLRLAYSLQKRRSTYTRLDQKALEASNTSFDQGSQLIGVTRDHTAVKANIDPALSMAGPKLLLKAMKSRGRRDGIQRHVHHSGHTTARSSAGASPEALPLSTARLVQVNVSVNKAREEKLGGMVDIVCAGREARWGEDLGND
ncbi:hypothetical protein HG530_011954 [Fusarium avenaceum]|nr:hypothetical protein HG530_011954 [Fusarium avenaceum]